MAKGHGQLRPLKYEHINRNETYKVSADSTVLKAVTHYSFCSYTETFRRKFLISTKEISWRGKSTSKLILLSLHQLRCSSHSVTEKKGDSSNWMQSKTGRSFLPQEVMWGQVAIRRVSWVGVGTTGERGERMVEEFAMKIQNSIMTPLMFMKLRESI